MLAVVALALPEAIIPLQATFKQEDLMTVKVEHTWTTGQGNATRDCHAKIYLPICEDPSKKEFFLHG
jgi:hypothetical protein